MAQVTVLILTLLLTHTVTSWGVAAFSHGKMCPEGQFYDGDTGLCGSCNKICQHANLTDMMVVERCQTLCPKTYAQLSDTQQAPELSALSQDQPPSSSSPSLPPVLLIAGILSGVVVVAFLVFLGAFVCKRMQENPGPAGADGQQQQGAGGSAERGLNRSRQGYRPASVQEEDNGGEQGERGSRGARGLRGYCDPRHWFWPPEGPGEEEEEQETQPRRPSTQERALLGNGQGSTGQDPSSLPKTVIATPIYKPSGSMRSTRI